MSADSTPLSNWPKTVPASTPAVSPLARRAPSTQLARVLHSLLLAQRKTLTGTPDPAPDLSTAGEGEGPLLALLSEQQQRWQQGERLPVEAFLVEHPALESDPDALLHLIYNEVLLREEVGEAPQLEEYQRRFPKLAEQLGEQFEVHRALSFTDLPPTPSTKDRQAGRDAHEVDSAVSSQVPQRLGDFEILRLLGAGSFARVYLARQVSLDRLVALKVSGLDSNKPGSAHLVEQAGSEARALAALEHDHIVRVFSEMVDAQRDLRLLCMQYVPGTTLARVINYLAQQPREEWSGRAVLDAIDRASFHPVDLDPAALRDREFLAGCDFIEAVCWVGARLAEALAYAHGHTVLHRDIKPANILLNRYGRPLLADFNLALDAQHMLGRRGETFGGTLDYMAPEHLDAFRVVYTGSRAGRICNPSGTQGRIANPSSGQGAEVGPEQGLAPTTVVPQSGEGPEAVDERSDLYALGVVLFELLTGELPPWPSAGPEPPEQDLVGRLLHLARLRRGPAPSARRLHPATPEVLDGVLRRCLDGEPPRRYQKAAELADALEGCRELQRIDRELPPSRWLGRLVPAWPLLMICVLTLLPHALGSLVNITYNGLRIVSALTPGQQSVFFYFLLGYNLLVYGVAVAVFFRVVGPVLRTWHRLSGPDPPTAAEVTATRRQVLALPLWVIALSCLGWLPGGLLFPLAIHLFAEPVAPGVFCHFLVSFTVSGLIALTYSYFGVQFVSLRLFYPRLWIDGRGVRQQAREELRSVERRLWIFQALAGLIPLTGAVLMVQVGPEEFVAGNYHTFRVLVTALIALGMAGFGVALLVSNQLSQTLTVLTGKR
jgi:serine/threonine protein kinase